MKNLNFNITVSKLAKICGVSVGTVDRALNGREGINSKTKERILSVAREYGYIEKDNQRTKLIGLVVFDLYNEYFSELVMHFEAQSQKNGYSVVVMFTDKNLQKEIDCIKQLYYMGVSSIVLCPINEGAEFENFLASLKIPIVTVGNRVNNISYVGIDNCAAMSDITNRICQDYRNVIYFSPALRSENNNYAQTERLKGFRLGCEKFNVNSNVVTSFEALEAILEGKNTREWAVICSSDYYLLRILLKYPTVAVAGFDNIHTLKFFDTPILTIDSNSAEIAKEIVNNLNTKGNDSCIISHKMICYGM